MPSKLGLGTVQFGLPYGITNQSGQVTREEAARILDVARKAGIDTLDTAIAYGESEQRLGELGVGDFRVVSKLGDIPDNSGDIAAWVEAAVAGSLERLRIGRLAGLLLHRSQSLLDGRGAELFAALQSLKGHGLVEKIGVSIYDPEELDRLSAYTFDIVQAPYNVIDRRLATSGWLQRLHGAQTEVHTRSAYLQGLLLLRAEQLPAAFAQWQPLWRRWAAWLEQNDLTALHGALGFVVAQRAVDRVIIGVESAGQLSDAVAASYSLIEQFPDELVSTDLELISPVRWRTT
jgi:aryl-alcohol dehydrogenase-like predicted oxidoreductase